MSNYDPNDNVNRLTLVEKKIIKSLLYPQYEVLNYSFCRIHTCASTSKSWLYTNLEGALTLGLDLKLKACRFFLYDLSSFEVLFECELYKKFSTAYTKGSERFYYFEVNKGFIGFEIPSINEAEILSAVITNLTDQMISKKIKEVKINNEKELKEKGDKMLKLLKTKFSQDTYVNEHNVSSMLEITQGELAKMIECVDFDENENFVFYGNGNSGIDEKIKKLKGIKFQLKNGCKVGDTQLFANQVANNIWTSLSKNIIVVKPKPKRRRKNDQGAPIEEEKEDDKEAEKERKEQEKKEQEEKKKKEKEEQEEKKKKEKEEKEEKKRLEKEKKEKEKREKEEKKKKEKEEKEEKKRKEKEEKEKAKQTSASVPQAPPCPKPGTGGVPLPPPIPKIVPIVTTTTTESKPSKSNDEPLDLAAEIAKKKGGLKKVEVKEYVPPALRKPGDEPSESSGGGNDMRSQLMRQMMNRGKKTTAPSNPVPTTTTAPSQPKPKPVTKQVSPKKPEPVKAPANVPPPKMGSGGVPLPPPIPKGAIVVPSKTSSKPSKSNDKPLDLAAEIAKKKNNLQKVEVKEYVPPALRKPGDEPSESSGGGNDMRSQLMRQMMNRGKKTTAPTNPSPAPSQPKPMMGMPKPQQAPTHKHEAPKPAPKKPEPVKAPANVPPPKMGSGGVPLPPPIPKGAIVVPSKSSSSKPSKSNDKPIDLAAEIAKKKGGLKKVEVKEYVPPALRKPGDEPSESSGGGNDMRSQLMRQMMNRGKKTTAPTNPTPATTAPPQNKPPMGMMGGHPGPKHEPPKPAPKKEEPKPKVNAPPPKMGAGGVPLPPPIPKIAIVTPSKTSSSSKPSKSNDKPIDLAAEIAKKKGGLKKVEVKEYVSPALKKQEEGGSSSSSSAPGGGNPFFAQLAAIKLKKIGK